MALRSLDNKLPITPERPKKQAKITEQIQKEKKKKQQPDFGVNNENQHPLSQAPSTDVRIDYTPETLQAIHDPEAKIQAPSTDVYIDYIPSETLQAIHDPEAKIQSLVGGLESKDWLQVCESLNDVRRLALFHSDLLLPILEKVVLAMVKAIKNPRSALCKTSIMASSDLFKAFGEKLLEVTTSDSFTNLLVQLLLKASQDKKFVCEEADRGLKTMVESIAPVPLLHKLEAHVGHPNLKVRAKAAISISNCVSKMDLESMQGYGLVALIQTAANLLNDKLPGAREAARSIVCSLFEAFTENEEEKQEKWQSFCQSNLPAIHAQAIVKLVSS